MGLFNEAEVEVLSTIIIALESGGAVYGNGDWGCFGEAYATTSIEHAITNDNGLFKNDFYFTHNGTNLNIRKVVSYYSVNDSRSVEYYSVDKRVPENFDFYSGLRARTYKKKRKIG